MEIIVVFLSNCHLYLCSISRYDKLEMGSIYIGKYKPIMIKFVAKCVPILHKIFSDQRVNLSELWWSVYVFLLVERVLDGVDDLFKIAKIIMGVVALFMIAKLMMRGWNYLSIVKLVFFNANNNKTISLIVTKEIKTLIHESTNVFLL